MLKKVFFIFSIFLLISLCFSPGIAQEFPKSAGMALFNRAAYDSAVTEIRAWIDQHPEEKDLASYYLAESYYNLGMSDSQVGRSRDFFRRAYIAFQETARSASMKSRFPKLYFTAQIKKGWCYFRRAETGEQPDVQLDNAYINFLRVEAEAPDTILVQSYLMAGESRYHEGIVRKYNALVSPTSLEVNKIISVFKNSTNRFNKVLTHDSATSPMKLFAEIRLNEIRYQLGKVYQSLPGSVFGEINDDQKQASVSATATFYFNQANFSNVISKYPESQQTPFPEFLTYAEAIKLLNKYYVTFQFEDKRNFLSTIQDVQLSELSKEVNFRQGTADHNTSQIDGNDNFFDLYQNDDRSFYYQALPRANSDDVAEAYFWLGTVQFVANQKDGINNLDTFIKRFSQFSENARISSLLNYARYWRGMLYLEEYRGDRTKIAELENFLNNFQPDDEDLNLRIQLLQKLTQLELDRDIKNEVLQVDSSPNWFNDAVLVIQYLLRRAATVVGENRLHYLQQLNKIFYHTNFQRSNETKFYQGISRSLEAEIQGDEDDKRNLFNDSADLLETVQAPYKFEADYIRARSLFFAEKYNDAKRILTRLINDQRSLRSLYYFAEILRQNGFGDAAKQCYEVIKQKTQNNPDGKFWFVNAESAINLCVNRADGSGELRNLNFQNVVFPDDLFDQSYEQLADRKFVRFQYLQESLDLLKKFSLPKKTAYIAYSSPANSIFKENILDAIPPILNELLRKETSVVNIFVMLPQSMDTPLEVTINDKNIEQIEENHYRSSVLNVGDHIDIAINKDAFYFFRREFDITSPGKQNIVVPLSEKVVFNSSTMTDMPLDYFSTPERLDENVIIQRNGIRFPAESKLNEDLRNEITFRDATFHQNYKNFLLVDSENSTTLRRYDNFGEQIEGNEFFNLDFVNYDLNELKEPEGIAIDYDGKIYITDFATHRVVVFDSLGKFMFHFGGFGQNEDEHQASPVKFTFPTRIAIEEDLQGFESNMGGEQTRIFRIPFILVADRYGIHRCDLEGKYIETIVSADNSTLPIGDIYSLGIDNYGRNAKIFIGLREHNRVLSYSATPAR